MFTYKDIQWVRNVKREGGENWAYFDENTDEMILHWSSSFVHQPTHAMKPKIGDIVVLFQKINTTNNYHFTHLLTPVDTIEHDCIVDNPKHRWGRRMKILARTKEIIKPSSFNLLPVNQGHTYAIELLDKQMGKEGIQKIVWNIFAPYFRGDVYKKYLAELSDTLLDDTIDNVESEEGKLKYVMHRYRERDRNLIKKKKASVTNPICECCKFDFSKTYPTVGHGFIECHHKIPIHKGERITSLDDLALVCANCHRMLHRKNKDNEYYTIKGLHENMNK